MAFASHAAGWRLHAESLQALGLWLVASACATWLLVGQPRPLAPTELPSLRLAEGPVLRALAEDEALAANAPDSEVARALDDSFLAQGRVDYGLGEPKDVRARREAERLALRDQVVAAHGEPALWALRAAAVGRFERALSDATAVAEAALPGILGVFPNQLAGAGVTRGGRELAPPFVAHVLYKARWNRLHRLGAARAFSPVERRAYFGWQALHGEGEPLPARLAAVHAYAAAGGSRADEALGALLFRRGDFPGAEAALAKAYGEAPHLRLRNYLAGVRLVVAAASHGR